MTVAEKEFNSIGDAVSSAEKGQLFGKACFKVNGKAFIAFFQDCMVFKLNKQDVAEALTLKGAINFDPSGKKRPMKEWVQIPYEHKSAWKEYADKAFEYVANQVK